MEKPDIKKIGLNLLEKMAMGVVEDIVRPYAKYYSHKNGITGLDGFIDDLIKKLNAELVDKIDGEDDIQ